MRQGGGGSGFMTLSIGNGPMNLGILYPQHLFRLRQRILENKQSHLPILAFCLTIELMVKLHEKRPDMAPS